MGRTQIVNKCRREHGFRFRKPLPFIRFNVARATLASVVRGIAPG